MKKLFNKISKTKKKIKDTKLKKKIEYFGCNKSNLNIN